MTTSKTIERAIVGDLVLSLTDQGFRVEMCSLDGGGLYLYAAPDGGEKPSAGWEYWIVLVEGNGANIISDYSVNFKPYIQSALKLSTQLEEPVMGLGDTPVSEKEMRQPTEKEMIEGIAKGFTDFLARAHPYGELSKKKISEAISEGVRKAGFAGDNPNHSGLTCGGGKNVS